MIQNLIDRNIIKPFVFITCLLGPIYYSLGVVFKDFPEFNKLLTLPNNLVIPVVVFFLLLSGSIFFYFRLRLRSIYGLTEVAIGVIIAINKVSQQTFQDLTESDFYLAILTASLYLVVRGLDNIYQGVTKEPFDPLAQKINSILKQLNV